MIATALIEARRGEAGQIQSSSVKSLSQRPVWRLYCDRVLLLRLVVSPVGLFNSMEITPTAIDTDLCHRIWKTRMLKTLSDNPLQAGAILVFFLCLAIVLAALGFEHIGGYRPCPLCLLERKAWYAALPLSALAIWLAGRGLRGAEKYLLANSVLAIIALIFIANAGLAGYHAGVEWKWWEGPGTCSDNLMTPLGGSGDGGLLGALEQTTIVRCDIAQFRLFGLSFSGYNFLMSLLAATISLAGIVLYRRKILNMTRQ